MDTFNMGALHHKATMFVQFMFIFEILDYFDLPPFNNQTSHYLDGPTCKSPFPAHGNPRSWPFHWWKSTVSPSNVVKRTKHTPFLCLTWWKVLRIGLIFHQIIATHQVFRYLDAYIVTIHLFVHLSPPKNRRCDVFINLLYYRGSILWFFSTVTSQDELEPYQEVWGP